MAAPTLKKEKKNTESIEAKSAREMPQQRGRACVEQVSISRFIEPLITSVSLLRSRSLQLSGTGSSQSLLFYVTSAQRAYHIFFPLPCRVCDTRNLARRHKVGRHVRRPCDFRPRKSGERVTYRIPFKPARREAKLTEFIKRTPCRRTCTVVAYIRAHLRVPRG